MTQSIDANPSPPSIYPSYPDHKAEAAEAKLVEALQTVRIYDNGGKTLDRYTVVYMDLPENRLFMALSMSEHPFQEIGQHTQAMPGRHLGKRIQFWQLPKDCQKLVKQDLTL